MSTSKEATQKPVASPPTTEKKKRVRKHGPKSLAQVATGSMDARRTAAVILEVLAGARATTDAASALSVSLPRYYALEARAIEGLVKGCEPRRAGRANTAERELAKLKKEHARLERENARSLALARASQRAIGLAPPPKKTEPRDGKKRRKRPVARALVAASLLRAEPAPAPIPPTPASEK